jgi:hypothetical protein
MNNHKSLLLVAIVAGINIVCLAQNALYSNPRHGTRPVRRTPKTKRYKINHMFDEVEPARYRGTLMNLTPKHDRKSNDALYLDIAQYIRRTTNSNQERFLASCIRFDIVDANYTDAQIHSQLNPRSMDAWRKGRSEKKKVLKAHTEFHEARARLEEEVNARQMRDLYTDEEIVGHELINWTFAYRALQEFRSLSERRKE